MNSPRYSDQRNKVFLGNLPEDFLRFEDPNQRVCASHAPTANGMSHNAQMTHQQHQAAAASPMINQITVCIVQASLVKSYSLTKMDPYVKLRIGHNVFETHSDIKGGKSPVWNKTVTSHLPAGVKTIHIEIYDENTLTSDERIAYADYVIPQEVLQGKFHDTFIPLSGKQGVDKEGTINITMSVRSVPYWSATAPLMVVPQPVIGQYPYYVQGNIFTRPHVIQYQQPMHNPNYAYPQSIPPIALPQPYKPTEEEIKQVQEMFPDYDREVITSILENSNGNKEQAISSLLSLSDK